MGRIAGPLKYRRRVVSARHRRSPLDPTKLIVRLPTKRRRNALLWLIDEEFGGELYIGIPGSSPLTPDMRTMIKSGLLRLVRTSPYGNGLPRRNTLQLTELGRNLLSTTKISPSDKTAISRALEAKSLD